MKKYLPLVFTAILLFSCKNDDEIIVQQCTEPSDIQTIDIGINTATFSWNDTNGPITFTIEYGPMGFPPGSGTFVNADERSVILAGLQARTSYDVYIQSICSTNNSSMQTPAFSFTTLPPLVVAQYLPNLSDLNLFVGDLKDLNPTIYAFEYELATPLFTDYAHKQRIIALPPGEKMLFVDDGFPDFPDNTVLAKTFSYNYDESDASLGKIIIETRVLIKINGEWKLGNYVWNQDQSDAVLSTETVTLPISYIDVDGSTKDIDYVIPSSTDCFTCHSNAGNEVPIGPKLRTLNFNDQLQDFIDNNYIEGLLDATLVSSLPVWNDTSFSREERARAYFDVNCAHCHSVGGYCEEQSTLRLLYETPFNDSNIYNQRFNILVRMQENIPEFSMPWIGTTIVHNEGFDLIQSYLNSLD